jgi:hypothetical protein
MSAQIFILPSRLRRTGAPVVPFPREPGASRPAFPPHGSADTSSALPRSAAARGARGQPGSGSAVPFNPKIARTTAPMPRQGSGASLLGATVYFFSEFRRVTSEVPS